MPSIKEEVEQLIARGGTLRDVANLKAQALLSRIGNAPIVYTDNGVTITASNVGLETVNGLSMLRCTIEAREGAKAIPFSNPLYIVNPLYEVGDGAGGKIENPLAALRKMVGDKIAEARNA